MREDLYFGEQTKGIFSVNLGTTEAIDELIKSSNDMDPALRTNLKYTGKCMGLTQESGFTRRNGMSKLLHELDLMKSLSSEIYVRRV